MIWIYVDRKLHESDKLDNIPVTIKANAPLIVTDADEHFVAVTVSGPNDKLKRLNSDDIKVNVSVDPNATVGAGFLLSITEDDVKLPRGLKVEEIVPERISINLDKIKTKSVPVRISTSGRPRQAYDEKEDERRVSPKEVTISGPSKLLEGIEELRTETEYFDENVYNSYNKSLKIASPFPEISVDQDMVVASFVVEEIDDEKEFEDLEISELRQVGSSWRIKGEIPKVERVSLKGKKESLQTLDKSVVHTFIDLSGITKEGKVKLPVKVWVDNPDIELLYVRPPSVEIFVEKQIVP